ncbi:ras GEF [Wolfiporia cocos MD-104 SS10]|uniref:Ras GEF n=1 Tax=Wolfiporia cocos (strain MD-104) TaxID=742152 RepID=A0A2H3JFD2_WOLCO|nr:ras GEF [Wolfiporia cocos MD-104 SS10]
MPIPQLRIDTSQSAIAGPSSRRIPTASSSLTTRTFRSRTTSSTSVSSSRSSITSRFAAAPSAPPDTETYRPWTSPDSASPSDENGPSTQDFVLALHDFTPQVQNVTCLAFRAGQMIRVFNRDPSGWWDGEVDGQRGWFPSNYVTSDIGLLTEEELPKETRSRFGHTHTASNASGMSAASWATAVSDSAQQKRARAQSFPRTDHRPMEPDERGTGADPYCPPLMVPLLQGLSLLQNAAKLNRIAHFQPSTAYIISCVRTVLTDVGCIQRDAPILKRHALLARERKRILSDLATLVSQSKRASDGNLTDELRDLEIANMVRVGGQLFAHVRGFLALVAQVEGPIPDQGGRQAGSKHGSAPDGPWLSSDGTAVHSDGSSASGGFGQSWKSPEKSKSGVESRIAARRKDAPAATGMPLRAKSMGDLKIQKQTTVQPDVPKLPLERYPRSVYCKTSSHDSFARVRRPTDGVFTQHRAQQHSQSSHSSSSSFSSASSVGTPATPVFPSGPSTTAEVMQALVHTHDHYLSTIAAFIGHAHSHSRTSHASSTEHMYDLTREVVDMVCKLLTIVDAVLKHPDLSPQQAAALRHAKHGLYGVTSKLGEAVRRLTVPLAPGVSEEEEKGTLLRCATDALKAGSDCVGAVKKCMQRSSGDRPFIIQLPPLEELATHSPRKFRQHALPPLLIPDQPADGCDVQQVREAGQGGNADGDATAKQPQFPAIDGAAESREASVELSKQKPLPNPWQTGPEPANEPASAAPCPPALATDKPLPPLRITTEDLPPEPQSPVSLAHTDDDGTTWEESQRRLLSPTSASEAKMLHGELPGLPDEPDEQRSAPIAWALSHDHAPGDVAYNSEGQLVGATLNALVEKMTPHDAMVYQFHSVFFLTFRLFATPEKVLKALVDRYNLVPPKGLSLDQEAIWQNQKGIPVRLRIANLVKMWLETYWHPATDNCLIEALRDFNKIGLAPMFHVPSQRIVELLDYWESVGETAASIRPNPPSAPLADAPRPVISKTLLSALRNKNFGSIAITDFDVLELARQLTTMECTLYCAIRAEEVLETGQEGGIYPVNVKAVTSLSTAITGFVAESILNELDTKKRTALVKFFIKLSDRCLSLNNFSTPRSILAALDSSTIGRLHQTWTGLPQKNRSQLEALRKIADHARNYQEYRSRLRNTAPPAVPFLGLYLTDVTFCREGNPSFRPSPSSPEKKLLNFNKYQKLARIIQDMQRFQLPYNLKPISEVHEYLNDAFEKSRHRGDLHDLYRRSLLVEPKQTADTPPSSDARQLFNWTSRSTSHHPPAASAT